MIIKKKCYYPLFRSINPSRLVGNLPCSQRLGSPSPSSRKLDFQPLRARKFAIAPYPQCVRPLSLLLPLPPLLLPARTFVDHLASSTRAPNLASSISAASSLLHSPRRIPQLHALAVISGLARSPFFAGKLIAKYSDLGDPSAARAVFVSTPFAKNSVFLWNSLIRMYARNGEFSEALSCYQDLQKTKLSPDAYTFPSVINACAGLGDLELGRRVHERVVELGFGFDLYIGNSLINMYSRFGSLDEACNVFDGMTEKDIVSWNCLVSGYSANGEWEKAVEVYRQLRVAGVVPDCYTVESVLPAFGGLGAVDDGQMIHGLVFKIGVDGDKLISNGLIAMYCRFDGLIHARRIFAMMSERDIVSWNIMIDGYYQLGDPYTALELLRDMLVGSKPDLVTSTIILHVCHDIRDLRLSSSIHGYIVRNGFKCDTAVMNALLATYGKCGSLTVSHRLFDLMDHKDSYTWNSLIDSYLSQGYFIEVVELFKLMMIEIDVKPDSVTAVTLISVCAKLQELSRGRGFHCYTTKRGLDSNLFVQNALLDMYSKCGDLEDALSVFEGMEYRDAVSWNTVICGCVHTGKLSLGFQLLTRMKTEGQEIDKITILGILPACSFVAAKRQGKEIHGCIYKLDLECDVPIGNALVEMYYKCGCLNYAIRVFEQMDTRDIVTWTALVCAYGMYGQGVKALRTFTRMEQMGILPDEIAFLSVMYACSHAGLVEEGKMYFNRMQKDYKMIPGMEHYACMVDILARSGKLVEAHKFIEDMPVEPDISIWGTLLGACQSSGEMIMAESVAKRITALETENTGYHVLISNLYASLGNWDMVGKVRKSMKTKNLKKDPGYSWIEIKNKIYVFGTGDQSLEQSKKVHQMLQVLDELMAKEGYIPDRQFVLQNVEEDDKNYMLCTHSERLAIAFGLLNTKPGTPLQIMKNLRACGDCHTAIKYISKIVEREILVRDANRYHLFKDGFCSCGDHW